jgi:hypothetical protein
MKNPMKNSISRRYLLRSAAGAAAAAAACPMIIPSSALGKDGAVAPSNRLGIGAIGVGVQGSGDLGGLSSGNQVIALCDVNRRTLERLKARYRDAATTTDFREVASRPDIDLVLIATPDHWHACMSIWAMRHGKDVYCEKPLSLTIKDGRAMVDTARRYGRVFSSGSQRVRGDYGILADYVASGAIGRIREIYVSCGGPSVQCNLPGEPVPDWLDWDMWLGPAPEQPYHPGRIASFTNPVNGAQWRNYFDFSGGGMTDWGAHNFGGAMYGAQLEDTLPVEITPPGHKGTRHLAFHFANGMTMYHGGGPLGGAICYVGTDGTVSNSSRGLSSGRPSPLRQYNTTGGIFQDFLHCVRTRKRPFQDVEYAHRVAAVCHLGNICYWLKRPLKFDPVKEVFIGDELASRYLDRSTRAPWRF